MKKIEYSISGSDVVPQNMIGDIFLGHPVDANKKIKTRLAKRPS
jgi:hypothetical protein